MIDYLLRNAFGTVSLFQVSSKLYYSCIELISFINHLKRRNIGDYFNGGTSTDSIRLEPFSFPDLIWSKFCQNNLSLYTYPLGDILERAIKKTLTSLFLDNSLYTSGRRLENEHFLQVLYGLSDSIDNSRLFGEFLSNFFFEQCMSVLRAKGGSNTDLGYSYQYKNGHLVPLEEQLDLRNRILDKCRDISHALVPSVLSSIRKRTAASSARTISDGLINVLLFINWQPENQRPRESNPIINIIVGTVNRSNLSSDYELDAELLRIILKGHKNVSFDLSKIESFVGHPLNSLTKDLLEIAFVIYISDLYVERNLDYSRNLNIVIPVRHPDIWSRVSKQLERTISFLARDIVNLNFTAKREHRDDIRSFNISDENKCCCLFSGGIDSAVGIIWALNQGLSPTLVSYSLGNLSGIQSTLVNQIKRVTHTRCLPHIKVSWQPSRGRSVSYRLDEHQTSMLYQHLRSFFYLSLAYAIAIESGFKTVYMFENGPVAINPLLSESSINTRTAHPTFLEYFRSTMRSVFNSDIDIINPFIYKTKSQLVSYIKNKGLANKIIPYTRSCFNPRVKTVAHLLDDYYYKGIHDGDCFPCIIRRVSLINGHVPAKYDEHLIDVFDIFDSSSFLRLPSRSLGTLVEIADLLRFCQCMLNMSTDTKQYNFPDLYVYSPGLDCSKMAKAYEKYAKETLRCFRNESSDKLLEVMQTVLADEI